MEYEDDDYDQYQKYEDELYKDAGEESESGSEVDSELEDNMLAHIHYSTDVYKKVGSNASKPSTNGSTTHANLANGRLAASPTPAEDYFKSVNQGNELDSENDEGVIKSSSRNKNQTASIINTGKKSSNQRDAGFDDQNDESRYSVEKKESTKHNWSQHAIAEINSNNESETEGEEYSSNGSIDGRAAGEEESSDEAKVAIEDLQLDQHVLDLGARVDDTQEETNYDLNAELGHLDNEDFKGRTRYYLESKEMLCYRCQRSGHIGRDCTTMMCNICGAKDDHVGINCPVSVCFNCKEKGHISENCLRPRGYGTYHRCERCYSKDHATNDCPTVWREYITTSEEPLQQVVAYCYNCAALGHFGDDCTRLRPSYAKFSESAFSSRSRARLIFSGSSNPRAVHHISTSRSTSGSSSRQESSSSRYDSHRSDRHGGDSRSSSSRRGNDYNDDHRSSHGGSRPQSHSKDEHRRRDHRDNRDDSYNSHRKEEEKRRQRSYRDLDEQGDSGSRKNRDYDRDDQEQLNQYAERSRSDRISNKRNKESSSSKSFERRNDHSSSSAMAPTTATGATMADNYLRKNPASTSRLGANTTTPIVIMDSPSSKRSHSRSRDTSSSRNKLHHSLPDNPGFRSQGRIPGGDNSTSSRPSFAEQNAFPRGSGYPGNTHEPTELIGVPPRPPGPMYTGGYGRRR